MHTYKVILEVHAIPTSLLNTGTPGVLITEVVNACRFTREDGQVTFYQEGPEPVGQFREDHVVYVAMEERGVPRQDEVLLNALIQHHFDHYGLTRVEDMAEISALAPLLHAIAWTWGIDSLEECKSCLYGKLLKLAEAEKRTEPLPDVDD